jgi:hypothetical protein
MNWRATFQLSLLALLADVMTGCVTSALWEDGRFVRFREPAAPPNLRLFESEQRQDILVQYDEWLDMSEKLRVRAYWLGQGHQPFSNPHKPAFVSAHAARGLPPIPIYDTSAFLAQTNVGLAAVMVWNPSGFTLYSGDRVLGEYALPVYEVGLAKTKKVLLTPLAVAVDAGLIAGYFYLLAYSDQCGTWNYH